MDHHCHHDDDDDDDDKECHTTTGASSSTSFNFGGGSRRHRSSLSLSSTVPMSGCSSSSSSSKTGRRGVGDGGGPDVRSGFFMRRSTQDLSSISMKDDSMTITKLQFHRLPLFGREEQIQSLEEALKVLFQVDSSYENEDASSSSSSSSHQYSCGGGGGGGCRRLLCLIRGSSGTGKTSLALHAKRWTDNKQSPSNKGCIFVRGKFDLKQMEEPYAAIKASLVQLCENLRLQERNHNNNNAKQQQLESIRKKLHQELEPELQSKLLAVIPELSTLMLGTDEKTITNKDSSQQLDISSSSSEPSSYKESSDLLKYAYRRFIQVLSDYMPLIFFIDDCQWIDKPSLELIRSWITDTNSNSSGRLLIIACYRSNEVRDQHILSAVVAELHKYQNQHQQQQQRLKQQNAHVLMMRLWEIEVDGIDVPDINQMLTALLDQSPEKTMEVAQLLHQRTKGNVFFVRQFLETMTQQNLLAFHWGSHKWIWADIDKIRSTLPAAENVADLLKDKLCKSNAGQRILPAAACLGCRFNKDTLGLVLQKLVLGSGAADDDDQHEPIDELLEQCQDEGFIDTVAGGRDSATTTTTATDGNKGSNNNNNNCYRFIHDKVQEASLQMIPKDELDPYKFRVGSILLEDESLVSEHDPTMLFTIVNLLNSSRPSTRTPLLEECDDNPKGKKFKIAKLNYAAGKKAMACSAFDDATTYLRRSIDLLEQDHWTNQPKSSVEIFSLAALAENCCGNFDSMKAYCTEVLNQNHRSILDKVAVYHVLMDGATAQFDIEQSIRYGLELLSLLGLKLPQTSAAIKLSGLHSLLRSKLAMNKKALENIASLPITTDPRELAITKTLDKLCTGCFLKRPDLLPIVICEMDRRMSRYGITPCSALAYSLLGILFNGPLGDFEGGRIASQKAVAVMDRCGAKSVEARCRFLLNQYSFHWKQPLQQCRQNLLEAYRVGMKTGDLDSACFALYHYLEAGLFTGQPLADLNDDFVLYLKQMQDYNMLYHWKISAFCWQALQNLRYGSAVKEDPSALVGDVYNETVELESIHQKKDVAVEANLRRIQMYTACYFGNYEKAANLALEWGEKANSLLPGQCGCVEVLFVGALSCFALARRGRLPLRYRRHHHRATAGGGRQRKSKYHQLAWKFAKRLKLWMRKGNPNCVAHDALLDAERKALQGEERLAMKHYEAATLLAGRRGLIHLQALANERFAIYLLERGNQEDGYYRMKEARNLFAEWGATKKVDLLHTEYEFLKSMSSSVRLGAHACSGTSSSE